MTDFNIEVELSDGVLYIANENSTGAEYEVESIEDIAQRFKEYLQNYIEE